MRRTTVFPQIPANHFLFYMLEFLQRNQIKNVLHTKRKTDILTSFVIFEEYLFNKGLGNANR